MLVVLLALPVLVALFNALDARDSAALAAADVARLIAVLFKPEPSLETALVAALTAAEVASAASEEAAPATGHERIS